MADSTSFTPFVSLVFSCCLYCSSSLMASFVCDIVPSNVPVWTCPSVVWARLEMRFCSSLITASKFCWYCCSFCEESSAPSTCSCQNFFSSASEDVLAFPIFFMRSAIAAFLLVFSKSERYFLARSMYWLYISHCFEPSSVASRSWVVALIASWISVRLLPLKLLNTLTALLADRFFSSSKTCLSFDSYSASSWLPRCAPFTCSCQYFFSSARDDSLAFPNSFILSDMAICFVRLLKSDKYFCARCISSL